MRLFKNLRMPLGKLVLCILLIVTGVGLIVPAIRFDGSMAILGLIAIAAGVLLLLDI